MSAFNVYAALLIATTDRPSYTTFTVMIFFLNFTVSYIDSLAEGISAVVTKMYHQVRILEQIEGLSPKEDNVSMKAFGNYNALRTCFGAIMAFVSGFLVTETTMEFSGFLLASYPIILCLYTLFIYREKRVRNQLKIQKILFFEKF